eukprot:1701143-Amphidinium_carterae.1
MAVRRIAGVITRIALGVTELLTAGWRLKLPSALLLSCRRGCNAKGSGGSMLELLSWQVEPEMQSLSRY